MNILGGDIYLGLTITQHLLICFILYKKNQFWEDDKRMLFYIIWIEIMLQLWVIMSIFDHDEIERSIQVLYMYFPDFVFYYLVYKFMNIKERLKDGMTFLKRDTDLFK